MSEDPNGRLPNDADEPREPLPTEDHPYCRRRMERVDDDACLECFCLPWNKILRSAFRLRTHCRDTHITPADPPPDRDARATEFIDLLARLAPEDFRAILVNIFETACAFAGESTSQVFFRQIRNHVKAREGLPL